MTPDAIALIVYGVVAVLAVGVVREVEGDWDAVADALPYIIAWPMAVVITAAVAVGWCLLWVVRGPIRLAIWASERRRQRAARSELPRAEVRR